MGLVAIVVQNRRRRRLRISPLVITSGVSCCHRRVQRRAEEAFGCLVNQSYAASESGPWALPYQYGRLHR